MRAGSLVPSARMDTHPVSPRVEEGKTFIPVVVAEHTSGFVLEQPSGYEAEVTIGCFRDFMQDHLLDRIASVETEAVQAATASPGECLFFLSAKDVSTQRERLHDIEERVARRQQDDLDRLEHQQHAAVGEKRDRALRGDDVSGAVRAPSRTPSPEWFSQAKRLDSCWSP